MNDLGCPHTNGGFRRNQANYSANQAFLSISIRKSFLLRIVMGIFFYSKLFCWIIVGSRFKFKWDIHLIESIVPKYRP